MFKSTFIFRTLTPNEFMMLKSWLKNMEGNIFKKSIFSIFQLVNGLLFSLEHRKFLLMQRTTANQSLTENLGLNGRIGRRKQKLSIITNFFKQLWKFDKNTKVVHYFDNSKEIFFEDKISKVWLKIKFKIFQHVEGATCQHLGVRQTKFLVELKYLH